MEQCSVNNNRLLTILTRDHGIVRCFLKESRRNDPMFVSSTGVLSYSVFSLYEGRSGYQLDEAVGIEVFYGMMCDIRKLSLAQYCCELAMRVIPEGNGEPEYLSLFLNTLYLLDRSQVSELVIKSVFELRLLSLAGFMPDVVGCRGCGIYEDDRFYFDTVNACLWCDRCCPEDRKRIPINRAVLNGLRTAVLAEPKKIFSFQVTVKDIPVLADLSEEYALMVAETTFGTLDYYKKLRDWENRKQ